MYTLLPWFICDKSEFVIKTHSLFLIVIPGTLARRVQIFLQTLGLQVPYIQASDQRYGIHVVTICQLHIREKLQIL